VVRVLLRAIDIDPTGGDAGWLEVSGLSLERSTLRHPPDGGKRPRRRVSPGGSSFSGPVVGWTAVGMLCVYSCTTCGHQVTTWGPREFYRDANGDRQAYGHPGPSTAEARLRGIAGFDAQKYCIGCGETQEVVLSELECPSSDPVEAWRCSTELDSPNFQTPGRCPGCGSESLFLALPEDDPPACPRCGQGKLVLTGGGVS
jgi:DNA-directed RNA polymerase subunit RPC12/RpoP